jgi:signal transduction histidine kinase
VIKTLRARLTAWYLLILALTLGLFTALLYFSLSRTLSRHHDDELFEQATSLGEVLAKGPLDEAHIAYVLSGSRAASRFVMLRNDKGELLYRSPVLQFAEPNIGLHEVLVHAAARGSREPEFFTAMLEHSGAVRFVCIPLNQLASAYLQVGNPLGDVPSTLHSILFACLGIVPLVLILTSFGGWIIARRALAPMGSINSTLQAIQATDLSRRISVDTTDEELAQLVTTLNQLLDRLGHAFVDLRQFAADVSHQLQTPLTVMQGSVEGVRQSENPTDAARAIGDLAEEIRDMSAVVAGLRDLALADTSRPLERIDLSEAVREAAEIISALGEAKHVSVSSTITPGLAVKGDKIRLKQVVLNLGDNAVKYTPGGGRVDLGLNTEGQYAILRVADSGIGIDPQHLPHVFDRFYRVDAARAGADGTGLGLAIVKRIVELHGGTIHVESRPAAGSTFTVALPLA